MREKLQKPPYLINLERLRNDKYFTILMLATLFLSLYAYYRTYSFRQDIAKTFPRLILGALIVIILFIFAAKATVLYEYLPEKDIEYPTYDMRAIGIGIAWSALYLLGIRYVGFFSSSFLFTFAFVMVHDDDELPRRAASAFAESSIIVGLGYVLLIEILGAVSIWRLGLLP